MAISQIQKIIFRFSYLRLKRYNEAKEALTRCPRVEGMFNCDSLLLELDAATAAAAEVEVASPVHPYEVELLMNISNADPAQPPQPVENLYVGAKLSLKQTLGEMLVAEVVSKVPGVRVGTKKLDIMLQLRDNEHDRQKSVLYMQDKKRLLYTLEEATEYSEEQQRSSAGWQTGSAFLMFMRSSTSEGWMGEATSTSATAASSAAAASSSSSRESQLKIQSTLGQRVRASLASLYRFKRK